ncbi:MAG: ceramidase domain-containing protein [Alphaproteobacteria bacterium]|nr:ceramidase domain-containing protein [Alphaproteobacteria bacterium]
MTGFCPSFIKTISPDLCRAVDIYCERTSPRWDAEPVNDLTNLAFFLAAWAAWRVFRRQSAPGDEPVLATAILFIAVIGAGSMTFHVFAVRWAEWADVIPILIFSLLYLWLAMTRFLRWPAWEKWCALVLYGAATVGVEAIVPSTVLWGGAMYLPTLAALIAFGLMPARFAGPARPTLQLAALIFVCSFTFRTLDHYVCSVFPIGTHFLWHLLNALLLYLLIRTVLPQSARTAS